MSESELIPVGEASDSGWDEFLDAQQEGRKFTDCYRCGGVPDYDEEGKPYTCYACCDTGQVTVAEAAAERQARTDYDERFRPSWLGIFERRMLDQWDWPEGPTPWPGHRLFTRLIHPLGVPVERKFDDGSDDLPF
jgi:hypothetical protein